MSNNCSSNNGNDKSIIDNGNDNDNITSLM